MTYTLRITGPGIDHSALMNSAENIDVARKVLDKIERDSFPATYFAPLKDGLCLNCGRDARNHAFGGMCFLGSALSDAGESK